MFRCKIFPKKSHQSTIKFAVIAAAMNETDEKWMRLAIQQGQNAGHIDEIPIGSCIVGADGVLIAAAFNRSISDHDPTAHAEILAIRMAGELLSNYRLIGTTVYSTIEPCAMCAGALVNARVSRLVYGAKDERFGAVDTHFGIGLTDALNHRIEIVGGVLESECRSLMQNFFRQKRLSNTAASDLT